MSEDAGARSTFHQINGLRLRVLSWGDPGARPLLALHGFPDSARLWRRVAPHLAQAGFRVIAPDQRGFGQSDAPSGKSAYVVRTIAADAIAVLDALGVGRAGLIGHDWGSAIGWYLAASRSDRFERYAALAVGHPAAYARAGLEQKLKAWYVLVFLAPGLAEALFGGFDFAGLRRFMGGHPETEAWVADLRRPGRLTAALNWYRANAGALAGAKPFPVNIPVMGIWSSRDVALSEDQMTGSQAFVQAPFRYERIEGVGHWTPLDAPERVGELLCEFFGGA